jgi:hypothetical protein
MTFQGELESVSVTVEYICVEAKKLQSVFKRQADESRAPQIRLARLTHAIADSKRQFVNNGKTGETAAECVTAH